MLTKNISRHEINCKCELCSITPFDVADYELITAVQDAVDFFVAKEKADKGVLIITSGNRCPQHNRTIGGADNSQHLYGKAMDFIIKVNGNRIPTNELASYLDGKYPHQYGIGKYAAGRVHLDVRPNRARWQG